MELFDNYAKKFDFSNDNIKRKYYHSYRVQALCEIIAKDLGFEENDIRLASLCGIFHDVARFKQATEFDTFDDTKSFDHGDVGADLFNDIFANDLNINEQEKELIKKAIKYHNKLEIGADVNAEDLKFCQIVRDADKIDILYQIANKSPNILNEIESINDACRKDFLNKKSLDAKLVTNDTEKMLLTLAYIWDINFDVSKKIIKDNKYYQRIEEGLDSEIFNQYFKLIYRFLEVK